ncbi:MAG: FAD-dependent oxidoreductase [Rubrivivax sp.]|nr:FAD-dependent oxidoreductase [Rubrivivax sp.]
MKRLLLVGAGHAHALVLLDWMRRPLPGVDVTVVSPQAFAPYSGMVPGWLAGRYRPHEIGIDFEQLAARAGARWQAGELHALDADRRMATLADGQVLPWDLLSLNVGSTLRPPLPSAAAAGGGDGPAVLALRPLVRLLHEWPAWLQRLQPAPATRSLHVTAVGGGAAGFESLLAVLTRLRALRPQRHVSGRLVSQGRELLPGFAPRAVRAAHEALARAGVELRLATPWHDGLAAGTDLVLWATGAEPHDWQADPARRGGLAADERGFLRVDAQLRSVSHPAVFAAGDCAAFVPPLPKAGVYAVRMGPHLARNLRAALGDGRAADYLPQRRFLALLATGDGRAIASRGLLAAEGGWVWRWKDHIDRGFVARFSGGAAAAPLP